MSVCILVVEIVPQKSLELLAVSWLVRPSQRATARPARRPHSHSRDGNEIGANGNGDGEVVSGWCRWSSGASGARASAASDNSRWNLARPVGTESQYRAVQLDLWMILGLTLGFRG